MDTNKLIEVLGMISDDAEKDAKNFDGKPFTGKTVGVYFGYHGAAISALADALKEALIKIDELEKDIKGLYAIS